MTDKPDDKFPEGTHYQYFVNRECEYFPCHPGIDPEEFNCLFCFCPAYALGEDCGGRFSYDNEKGIKDCKACGIPHIKGNYQWMVERAGRLTELVRKK